jgi:hypothetical protein
MSPIKTLPSVAFRSPEFPKSIDFIPLNSPQFGHRIGDSCLGFPWVPVKLVTDLVTVWERAYYPRGAVWIVQASLHTSTIIDVLTRVNSHLLI